MIMLDVLINPRPNGYTTGGLYLEDREGDCDANYCLDNRQGVCRLH